MTELYNGTLRLADVPYRVHDLGYGAVELQDMFLWPQPPNPIARAVRQESAAVQSV